MADRTTPDTDTLTALSAAVSRAEQAEARIRLLVARIQELEAAPGGDCPERELLQAITDNMLGGIMVLDGRELRAKWANPACLGMLDRRFSNLADIAGLPLEEFLPGAEEIGLARILRRAARTGRVQSAQEKEYGGFERGMTNWTWSVVPLPAADGEVPDLLAVTYDVTEQVHRRRQVEEVNETLRTLIDTLPAGVLVADAQGTITLSNAAANLILGGEITGNAYGPNGRYSVLTCDGTPFAPDGLPLARALRGLSTRNAELLIEHDAGRTVACLANASPVRDAEGRIVGAVATMIDVTERNRADQERQAALEELRQAHEELEQRVRDRTRELVASKEELQTYARRLVEAVENERRSLARELHDTGAQSMSVLKLSLGRLRRAVDSRGEHAARFEDMGRLIDGVMDELHRLAMNLRPISLDRYGLVPALEQYLTFCRNRSGLDIDLVAVGVEEERLPLDVETALYRVVQEALTNVVRHARAEHVDIMLERQKDQVIAVVEDDGRGFDLAEALACGRLGLAGMRERAVMLGGELTIESAPGEGTAVQIRLPVRAD